MKLDYNNMMEEFVGSHGVAKKDFNGISGKTGAAGFGLM